MEQIQAVSNEDQNPFQLAVVKAVREAERANELAEQIFQPEQVPQCKPIIFKNRNTGEECVLMRISGPQGTECWSLDRFHEVSSSSRRSLVLPQRYPTSIKGIHSF